MSKRTLKAQVDVVTKLSRIRALYAVVYNSRQPLTNISDSFFHAVGDILEGKQIDDISLIEELKQPLLDEVTNGRKTKATRKRKRRRSRNKADTSADDGRYTGSV